MKKISGFLKKYWLFILLPILITILAGFYFNRPKTEQKSVVKLPPLTKPEINSQASIIPEISQLEKNFPVFNQEAEVYQVKDNSFSDQEAINISKKFGFQENPKATRDNINGSIYRWSNETSNLSVYLRNGEINYGLNLLKNPQLIEGEPPSLEEAELNFRSFLKENGLFDSEKVSLELKKANFAKINKGYFEETTVNDQGKKLAYLEFVYKINNFEVQGIGPIQINVYLGPKSKIVNLNFMKTFNQIADFNSYPLKSKEEILQILKNKPQITFLRNPNSELEEEVLLEYALQQIKELTFDKIELVYFKGDSQQSFLQPVYLISGDAYLPDVGHLNAGFYLPAVQDQYLLK
jgi:hypothetical protein